MNQETEQAVIGSILINPKILDDVAEIISPMDFSGSGNAQIFSAMLSVANDGKVVDSIEVGERLGDRLEIIGGMSVLADIMRNTASSVNAVSYARIIKDHSNKTNLLSKIQEAADIVRNSQSYDDAAAGVNAVLATVEANTGGYKPFDEIIKSQIQSLDRRHQNGGVIEGITTGLTAIDQRLLGLAPGDFWLIGARPRMGKTVMALNITEHVSRHGGHVLFFSCEMTKEQLVDRYFSSVSKVNSHKIRSAQMNEAEWGRVAAGVPTLKGLPIHIIDTSSIDINHAITIARKFNRKAKLSLIVIDYVQLLRYGKLTGYDCVTEVSRSLKDMAKMIGCPVIALSQLNRDLEKRPDKRPMLSDLRSSGQLEQDADIVTFIYRDEVYDKSSTNKGTAELITAKARNGESGTDYLDCNMSIFRFSDSTKIVQMEPQKETYIPFKR